MKALTLINRAKADEQVIDALRAAGVARQAELVDGDDIADRAAKAVRDGVELLVVGGGDGTVSAAAQAAAGTETRLAILPMGTLNHFARDLAIPLEPKEAAKLIAAGRERRVDVAEVNGRVFVNNAAIGLYPLMIADRDSQRRRLGRSKRLAMLVASVRTMSNFHSRRLRLSADGGEARIDTPMLFVGNNDYRLAMPGAGQREALDRGELCVMVMRSKSLPGFLAATARALLGISRSDDMVRLDGKSELRVDSSRSVMSVAVDGESVRFEPPLVFRIRPLALKVIA